MSDWKKIGRAISKPFEKVAKELHRPVKQVGDIISGIIDPDDPAGPAPLPPPDPPIAMGMPGIGAISRVKKFVRGGRGGTILTGNLIPQNVGKSRLLGD